jgi:tetratricopeptide (TPR) repeat protein
MTQKGFSDICPEVTKKFLSLDYSLDYSGDDKRKLFLFETLRILDNLVSCEVNGFYKAVVCLEKIDTSSVLAEERNILLGLKSWALFDYEMARYYFLKYLENHACDVLVVFMIHMLDFNTGKTSIFRDGISVMDVCEKSEYYTYFLGMKSFIKNESKDYKGALIDANNAIKIERKNIYAIHAVAHVYHDNQEWGKLIDFLESHENDWVFNSGMRMHVYWHLAMAYLYNDEPYKAISSFKRFYAFKKDPLSKEDLDAVAFLWRMHLKYSNAQELFDSWDMLALSWVSAIDQSTSFFHKMHAALAFSVVGKSFLIDKMILGADRQYFDIDTYEVGISILCAIKSIAERDYASAYQMLNDSKDKWYMIGGSRAQLGILQETSEYCLKKIRIYNADKKYHYHELS